MAVENLPLGQTTSYSVQIAHSRDEGIYASPVGGDEEVNCSIVRLHSPIERLSVFWMAVSEGKPPLVPSPLIYSKNGNRVFTGGDRVGVMTPAIVGHTFTMAGRLDYIVVAPEGLDSQFNLAMCPWEQAQVSDFYIPATNFLDTGIVNDGLNSTGILQEPYVPILAEQLQTAIPG
jgi:hypothetical protein